MRWTVWNQIWHNVSRQTGHNLSQTWRNFSQARHNVSQTWQNVRQTWRNLSSTSRKYLTSTLGQSSWNTTSVYKNLPSTFFFFLQKIIWPERTNPLKVTGPQYFQYNLLFWQLANYLQDQSILILVDQTTVRSRSGLTKFRDTVWSFGHEIHTWSILRDLFSDLSWSCKNLLTEKR